MSRSEDPATGKSAFKLNRIFAETNRGVFFDLLIFLANIFLMHLLTGNFILLVRRADGGDTTAGLAMFLFCLGIYILPPLGAILKRPHFHQRLKQNGIAAPGGENFMMGCLFNPIIYFCLNLVIISALNAFIISYLYNGKDPGETVFISMVFGGLIFTIVQTVLIYRYFSAPKREPKTEFFRSPRSELFGDLCIFVNMLLFQVMWNVVGYIEFGKVSGVEDFLGRLFFITFVALLIYFPPRVFFLAEDIKRPTTWITILLANSPVIIRVLFGGFGSGGTFLQN